MFLRQLQIVFAQEWQKEEKALDHKPAHQTTEGGRRSVTTSAQLMDINSTHDLQHSEDTHHHVADACPRQMKLSSCSTRSNRHGLDRGRRGDLDLDLDP
ncbi:hypothetical protein BaRGS_00009156 [Batillaria attramentaria]|uniref:Uncharacterized protein n=1 Tax=Batillaria attramentaria TaxID=370345 RepID=A0ABD0LIZ6_9CAEN